MASKKPKIPKKRKKKKKLPGKSKKQAGMLLSRFLREIAEEETEFVNGDDNASDRMVTKAEALSRTMWKMALGFEEVDDKGGITKHAPDRGMMTLIYDRMEGKAPASISNGEHLMTAAGKVSEQAKNNIADAGKLMQVPVRKTSENS